MKKNWNDKYKRPTIGAIAPQAEQMESPSTDVRELQRGMASNKMDHVHRAIERGLKQFQARQFYILVTRVYDDITKTIRNRYAPTTICPTPTFNSSVFEYDRQTDDLQLLWVIPNVHTCNYLIRNSLRLNNDDRQLLKYIMDFRDGILDRMQTEKNTSQKRH